MHAVIFEIVPPVIELNTSRNRLTMRVVNVSRKHYDYIFMADKKRDAFLLHSEMAFLPI